LGVSIPSGKVEKKGVCTYTRIDEVMEQGINGLIEGLAAAGKYLSRRALITEAEIGKGSPLEGIKAKRKKNNL